MDPGASLTVNEPRGPRRRRPTRRLIRWTLIGLAALVLLLGVGVATAWILFRLRGPELIRAELEGALVTALLFQLGRWGISFYLARSTQPTAFGAAASFAALLLWLYYSAQIFLLGAEFTACLGGSRVTVAEAISGSEKRGSGGST